MAWRLLLPRLLLFACLLPVGCTRGSPSGFPRVTFDCPSPYSIVVEYFDGVPMWFLAEDQAWLTTRKLAPEEVGRFVAQGADGYQPGVEVSKEVPLTRLGDQHGNGYLHRREDSSGYTEVIIFDADTDSGTYLVTVWASFDSAVATRAFTDFIRLHLVLQVE